MVGHIAETGQIVAVDFRQGNAITGQDTYRTRHCIGDDEKSFTLILQRKAIQGQTSLDLDSPNGVETINWNTPKGVESLWVLFPAACGVM